MSDTKLVTRAGFYRASKVIGVKVETSRGEPVGKIEDLVLDPGEGRVAAAIIATGGFLGVGERLIAIPILALSVDAERGKFILDVDKEMLDHAPSFKKDEWPDLIDRVWTAEVYTYYGYPRYWP
ncbi:MAG TPA: PRC-barrel domain-containing protein [Planctomycetota bacterium]|nr:PRC-barrel domain-containing protein [Planctomycetota bacterium]